MTSNWHHVARKKISYESWIIFTPSICLLIKKATNLFHVSSTESHCLSIYISSTVHIPKDTWLIYIFSVSFKKNPKMDISWFKINSLNRNQEIHKSQTNTLWSTESEKITSPYYCFFQCYFCQLKLWSPRISKAGQRDFLKNETWNSKCKVKQARG